MSADPISVTFAAAVAAERMPQAQPCALAQRRFWLLDQLDPGNPSLNVAVRWRLEGEVSQADLEYAFQYIVTRHETLRTRFERHDGEPFQVIEALGPLRVSVVDLRGLAEDQALIEAERLGRAEAGTPFDLGSAPLLRVTWLRLRDEVSLLLVTAHHIVCDGWSIGVLAREFGVCCAARQAGRAPALPALALAYRDYAAWQNEWLAGEELQDEAAFWRRELAGLRQFELPTDRPRPAVQTTRSDIRSILLERTLTDGLAALARRHGSTLFMAALAALLTLLHCYTGETDIALGSQVAGRDEVELEDLVGLFINTLVLRNDLSGDPPFETLLARVRERVGEAFEHQHMPLEKLIEIVRPRRDLSRNPLFSVNFIFQRSFIRNETYDRFRLVDQPSYSAGAIYDLNFFMVERPDGWRASCEYNTDLFETATITRLLGHFQNLLRAIVAEPAQPLSQLAILDADEREALIADAKRTATAYPRDATLPQLFAAQVARTPDAVALTCAQHRLSYRELDAAANRMAQALRARGVAPGSRVGVFLERSPELLIALLAVQKAGCAYVPLDPNYPAERLAHVIANSRMAALVTRRVLTERLAAPPLVLLVDGDAAAITAQSAEPLPPIATADDLAYVIYTSGSTGQPKGVQIRQRALVNLLWAMRREPGLAADDVLLAVTTVSFDIAALELFLPLIVGAQVVLAREDDSSDGARLLRLLREQRVTVMQATPVTWQLLLEAGWRNAPKLKALCGGEAMPRQLANTLLAQGTELWNLYGPTETTIWSSVERVQPGEGPVPLGTPIANTQFHVLDAQQQLVPPGAPGELCIGGDGVAPGYFDLPDATRERFIADPFGAPGARLYRTGDLVRRHPQGWLEYLGRADQQIKLRGFRIELGEIEAALLRQPGVADAAAVLGQDAAGEGAIWAYVVPRSGAAENLPDALRAGIAAAIPRYMQPSAIVVLAQLPRTPNGKLDRRALPPPVSTSAAPASRPANAIEQRLAQVWNKVLGREVDDVDADFFELGGHSLLAARLLGRIETEFGKRLSLAALFAAPSIAGQARLLARDDAREFDFRHVVHLHAQGAKTPLIAINNTGVQFYNLSKRLGAGQPLLALQVFDPALTRQRLPETFTEIAAEYVRLIRDCQPQGPYALMGWCIGGALAFEVARQLRAAGQEVSLLVLIDTWAPGHLQRLGRLRGFLADRSYRWQLIVADWLRAMRRNEGVLGFLGHRRVVRRLRRWLGHDLAEAPPEVSFEARNLDPESYDQWLLGYLQRGARDYPLAPYPGRIRLLRSAEEPKGLFLDPTMGWRRFAEAVDVVDIDGDHFTMFRDRGLEQIALAIAEEIKRPAR